MVDDRLLEAPELCSNRVVKVLQACAQEVRVLIAEIRNIRHFIFLEGMNFAELPTSSGLRELGRPRHLSIVPMDHSGRQSLVYNREKGLLDRGRGRSKLAGGSPSQLTETWTATREPNRLLQLSPVE